VGGGGGGGGLSLCPQRCPNKIFKTFLIKIFFHLPTVSTTLVVHLELQKFLNNFETALMGYSGAGGKLIHEKNLKPKRTNLVAPSLALGMNTLSVCKNILVVLTPITLIFDEFSLFLVLFMSM
jgi:hypothetical protein